MPEQKKLRVGWFTFTCCEDSTVVFTEIMNDHFEEWRRVLDIRHARVLQSKNVLDQMDVAFVEGAIDWRLQKFSDLPAALAAHRDELAGHTVVSYCTGGIRCEKAALVMQGLGLDHAMQLDGGILKYFDDTGGTAPGWRGACFVFDDRVALAPSLQPAGSEAGTTAAWAS
jgi:UPF0176 protein